MTLVDASVWIAHFRAREPFQLEQSVPFDDVVTCLPVIQEVLQGVRDELAFRTTAQAMFALPIVEAPLGEGVFREAVGLYRTARRRGLTVRSSIDCLIAACALRHDHEVLHDDRDFGAIARISDLKQRRIAL